MDAATGQLFTLYHPSGRDGHCQGNYSSLTALADAMVIDFCVKNKLRRCEIAFRSQRKKARNGPSTQLVEATSVVERSNTMMKVEELSYFSSYQMLTTDKNY